MPGQHTGGDFILWGKASVPGLEGEEELQMIMSGRKPACQAEKMARRSLSSVPPPLALWVVLWAAVGQGLLGQRPRWAEPALRTPPAQAAQAHTAAHILFPRANGDSRHQLPPFSSHSSEYPPPLWQSTLSDPVFTPPGSSPICHQSLCIPF